MKDNEENEEKPRKHIDIGLSLFRPLAVIFMLTGITGEHNSSQIETTLCDFWEQCEAWAEADTVNSHSLPSEEPQV